MHLLITSGPTREPIDTVRFISNRSSGRLGAALASAAAQAGHTVTLLLGPGALQPEPHDRLTVVPFTSTANLLEQMQAHFGACDALVMAAAVADYTPKRFLAGKAERSAGMTIELVPTPDLVATIAPTKRDDQRVIAFALEEHDNLERRGLEKMRRKRVDAIVANPLVTMDADSIEPIWLTAGGEKVSPGTMSKAAFAPWLLSRIEGLRSQPQMDADGRESGKRDS